MLGFTGKYAHNLDEKGRIVIPSKLMDTFNREFKDSEGFMLANGLEHCIDVYPLKEWHIYTAQITSIPQFDKNARHFSRFLHHNSYQVYPDTQNRISLPQDLRDYANIKDKVLICGNFNKLELWNEESWKLMDKTSELNYEAMAEQMARMTLMRFANKDGNPISDPFIDPNKNEGKK